MGPSPAAVLLARQRRSPRGARHAQDPGSHGGSRASTWQPPRKAALLSEAPPRSFPAFSALCSVHQRQLWPSPANWPSVRLSTLRPRGHTTRCRPCPAGAVPVPHCRAASAALADAARGRGSRSWRHPWSPGNPRRRTRAAAARRGTAAPAPWLLPPAARRASPVAGRKWCQSVRAPHGSGRRAPRSVGVPTAAPLAGRSHRHRRPPGPGWVAP
mmetsp:Transcript_61603/g.134927  ORF Transcript_61603/g.134927 Transcript_61603/m.134927 type:complete len:214 (+) Transcript_61603:1414-2055(+)